MGKQKAIFLDLFGTLIHDHGAMDNVDSIRFKDKSIDALKKLQEHGYIAFLSVCRIDMPIPERSYLEDVQSYVMEKLLLNGIEDSSIYFVSYVQPQRVELHPLTLDVIGSLEKEHNLKLSSCVLVGDIMKDIKVGKKAGVKTALLSSPDDTPMEVDDEWVEPDMIFGGKVVVTSPDHTSGTDRIVEAVEKVAGDAEIVVNIQGDEPLVRPSDIDKCVAEITAKNNADWATLIYKLDVGSEDPNTVKVVCDSNGFALYFSRAQIPFDRDGNTPIQRFGHIGLYVYKIKALKKFASLKSTPLELAEKLEQLRALESGMKIVCVKTEKAYPGIDTPEDLANVNEIIKKNPELLNIK